jgi:HEXXH motif-containing protein
MWATVNSNVGLAEAIVHEMAHHKMRAFGVGFERAEHLVANPPGERYPSPLLGGRPRPMPALLHAHYALLHMVALELEIAATGVVNARPIVAALLRRHLELIDSGEATLRRNLVVDEYGAHFLPALRNWQARLLTRAEIHR